MPIKEVPIEGRNCPVCKTQIVRKITTKLLTGSSRDPADHPRGGTSLEVVCQNPDCRIKFDDYLEAVPASNLRPAPALPHPAA